MWRSLVGARAGGSLRFVRNYVVQRGDSPAKIAIEYAGCPKCVADLVDANPHKPFVTLAGGFRTFRELGVGESLNLPDKWFDGTLDRMPQQYFDALPAPPATGKRQPAPSRGPSRRHGLGSPYEAEGRLDEWGLSAPISLTNGQRFAMTASTGTSALTGPALAGAVLSAFSGPNFEQVSTGLVQSGQTAIDVTGCYVGTAPLAINPTLVLNGITLSITSAQVTGSCLNPIYQPNPNPTHLPPGPPQGGGGQQQPQPQPPHQGASVFTMQQGHRITSTATSNAPLPAQIANETVASLQAQFDQLHPGQYHVVSVSFPSSNQVNVVADYCGPTTTVPSPSQSVFGGVTVQFTYTDNGTSPAGTVCTPSSSSSSSTSSTSTIVAVIAGLVVAGGAYWALSR